LSLDGGGLRGIITAILLDRLETSCPGFLASVDLFVGTSTGGILALALAAGLPPATLVELYENQGAKIFQKSIGRDLLSLGNLVGAEYDNRNLRKILKHTFGSRLLAELNRKVAIPAFKLDTKDRYADGEERGWRPKIFHNYEGYGSDENELVADVALYTSSAPTYFPTSDSFIDGGVVANNPSMVAVAQALDVRCQPSDPLPPRQLKDLVLLSVGTGMSLTYLKGDRLDWGVVQWARPLLNILMDGVADIADFQCCQILGERYERLQTIFMQDDKLPLDGVKKLSSMISYAKATQTAGTVNWIGNVWFRESQNNEEKDHEMSHLPS
jgi:hypothetical protein